MAIGIYGTKKLADVNIDDVDILYSYSPSRESIGDVDMKNSETLIITDNVSTQGTVAEVVKLLLLDSLAYSEILGGKSLEIIPFDNCREYGYMYHIVGGKQDLVFSVYEHRNSDEIIINGGFTSNIKPHGIYNGGSKWDYLNNFMYNEHYAVAKRLREYLEQSYVGTFDESALKGDNKCTL